MRVMRVMYKREIDKMCDKMYRCTVCIYGACVDTMLSGLVAAGSYRIKRVDKRAEREECSSTALLIFSGCAVLFLLLFFYYTETNDYTIR